MYKKGIYRQMGLLKKPSHMTRKDFEDWLLNIHAEKGKFLPNLKRYSYCLTLDSIPSLNPPYYDAFAEAWFDSLDSLKEANDSDVMKGQIEDVEKHYKGEESKLVKVIWAKEYIIDLPGDGKEAPNNKEMYCQMGHLKCPSHMTQEDLKDWWLNTHAETGKFLEDLRWYTVLFTLKDSPFGTPSFDGYAEVWFDNFEALKDSFKSDIMKTQFEDVKKHGLDDPALHKIVIAKQFLIELP